MGLSDFFKKDTLRVNVPEEAENFRNLSLDSDKPLRKNKSSIPTLDGTLSKVSVFLELRTETIEKIKNNPFWGEYSFNSQEKMVSKYFDNKIKRSKYNNIKYNLSDKKNFIEEVLRSVV